MGIGFDFDGMPARVTPTEDHYVVDKNTFSPGVNNWTLDIQGAVDEPYTLTEEELRTHPATTSKTVTMVCISNTVGGNLISTAEWTGIPLGTLLEDAQVTDDAVDVVTFGLDGYREAIPLASVSQTDPILAFDINGQQLPSEHGYPLRLLIPGRYGMRSTKWVSRIAVATKDEESFWEERGWDETAVINTLSYIRGAERYGDRVAIGGVSYAGLRGIQGVEVSVDGGDTWHDADLEPPVSDLAWRRWKYDFERPGATEIDAVVRAVDGQGTLQTAQETDPHPGGSTGWHRKSISL